ncbi:MAG: hypothetical protein KJ709_09175 [Nanoarchaeota archaeon]|nr:hypothetical protein [Nanoarchaeota archaeon]
MKLRREIIYFVAAVLLFLFLHHTAHDGLKPTDVLGVNDQACVERMRQGLIYKDDLFCMESPMSFLLPMLFGFPFSTDSVPVITLALLIIVNAATVLLLNALIKRNTKKDLFFLTLSVYAFTVYAYTSYEWSIALTTFFLILGYYLLAACRFRMHEVAAGAIFGLALATKGISLAIVASLFAFLALKALWFWFVKKRLPRKAAMKLCYSAISALAVVGLLLLVFGNWLVHGYWVHAMILTPPFDFILKSLATHHLHSLNLFNMQHAMIFLLGLVLTIWRRKGIGIFGLYAFIVTFFTTASKGMYDMRFLAPSFAFLLLVMIPELRWDNIRRIIFSSAILLLLIGPSLIITGFELERNRIHGLVNDAYHLVPEQELALVEANSRVHYLDWYGRYDQIKSFDVLYIPVFPDQDHLAGIIKFNLTGNLSGVYDDIKAATEEQWDDAAEKILEKRYSLIVFGEPEYQQMTRFTTNYTLYSGYCTIMIPYYYSLHGSQYNYKYLFFRDPEDCTSLNSSLERYFTENLDRICRSSEAMANDVSSTLAEDGILLPGCVDGGSLLETYHAIRRMRSTMPEIYFYRIYNVTFSQDFTAHLGEENVMII